MSDCKHRMLPIKDDRVQCIHCGRMEAITPGEFHFWLKEWPWPEQFLSVKQIEARLGRCLNRHDFDWTRTLNWMSAYRSDHLKAAMKAHRVALTQSLQNLTGILLGVEVPKVEYSDEVVQWGEDLPLEDLASGKLVLLMKDGKPRSFMARRVGLNDLWEQKIHPNTHLDLVRHW